MMSLPSTSSPRRQTLRACLGLSLLLSCAVSPPKGQTDSLVEVWRQEGWPPASLPPPTGFQISPRRAFEIVAQSGRLPLKHAWFCYRSQTHYFVADRFAQTPGPGPARQYGVRVHGLTGQLEQP